VVSPVSQSVIKSISQLNKQTIGNALEARARMAIIYFDKLGTIYKIVTRAL